MKLAIASGSLALGATAFTYTVLPRPAFPGPSGSPTGPAKLQLVSSKTVGISPVSVSAATGPTFRGYPPQQLIPGTHGHFVTFGRNGATARILVAYDKLDARRYAYDFGNYVYPPGFVPAEKAFVYEQVTWAREAGGTLYVENSNSTYATSTNNRNAYVTAIDLETSKVRWRSPALVANASNFLANDRYLITGYGFTKEKDYLYLIDRKTGRAVSRLALPSAPEQLGFSGLQIRVRTYDHVVVARIAE